MSGESLSELIACAVENKSGNKEFALFRFESGHWMAMLGNPSSFCLLGENDGEFDADGDTAEEAVKNIIEQLSAAAKPD